MQTSRPLIRSAAASLLALGLLRLRLPRAAIAALLPRPVRPVAGRLAAAQADTGLKQY
ncbi:hypothetical protein [Paludibacterium yongneupense]|uniref:hypothetical protein n=1 Tax=Paludibacterium yongneupense TaxID=400061 RepID=UPI0003F86B4C|nr:hypothetical protein [Paludibacterium yongneupense]